MKSFQYWHLYIFKHVNEYYFLFLPEAIMADFDLRKASASEPVAKSPRLSIINCIAAVTWKEHQY